MVIVLMRIIAVVSGKGGVGKTTITSNLGVLLSHRFNKKVVVLDGNITTPHLGMFLGMDHTPTTLNHALRGEADLNEALYHHSERLWVVPASVPHQDMKGVDISLMEGVIKKFYTKYVGKFDMMLIDCAPGLGREAMAAMRAADEVLFVTIPHLPALMDVVRCNHSIRESGIRHVGVVVNQAGQGRHELSRQEVERVTGLPVVASIHHDKKVLHSLSKRLPVTSIHPKSKASKQLEGLASVIMRESLVTPQFKEAAA